MVFALALLYLLVAFLGVNVVFGTLGRYHLEEMLLVITFCASIPALQKAFVQKTIQSLALVGLSIAVFLSIAIGFHYPRFAVTEFLDFIPNAFAYFLVILHCKSKLKLKILVLLLFGICLFVIGHGVIELRSSGGYLPAPTNDEEIRAT